MNDAGSDPAARERAEQALQGPEAKELPRREGTLDALVEQVGDEQAPEGDEPAGAAAGRSTTNQGGLS